MLSRHALSIWSKICGLLEKREHKFLQNPPPCPFSPQTRIALVKQSSYGDLYSDPSAKTPKDLLSSSWHRTGPIGLFLNFQTDFFIVHVEDYPECRVWEEKLAYETPGSPRAEIFPRNRTLQESRAVSCSKIDWSIYDIVIAIENAVPARITRKYPRTLWCTLLEHHKLKPYRPYLREPPPGYDVFLNLRHGPTPQSFIQKSHVVDFPYGLNDVHGLASLYRQNEFPRAVMLEDHQNKTLLGALLDQRNIPWLQGGEHAGSLDTYLTRLSQTSILLAPNSSRPLGGLAALDASAMDCLVIGNRAQCWNPFLILPELDIRNEDQAVNLAADLLNNPSRFQTLLKEQRQRLHWFAWVRPLQQLHHRLQIKREGIS